MENGQRIKGGITVRLLVKNAIKKPNRIKREANREAYEANKAESRQEDLRRMMPSAAIQG